MITDTLHQIPRHTPKSSHSTTQPNIVTEINKKIASNNNYLQAQKEENRVRNMEKTAKIMSKSINEKYIKNSKKLQIFLASESDSKSHTHRGKRTFTTYLPI